MSATNHDQSHIVVHLLVLPASLNTHVLSCHLDDQHLANPGHPPTCIEADRDGEILQLSNAADAPRDWGVPIARKPDW
ncbi:MULTISPECIES: hypothetical protein [Bacteria]